MQRYSPDVSERLRQNYYDVAALSQELLRQKRIALGFILLENSVGWYILCETKQNLIHLWKLYESGELQSVLSEIYNAVSAITNEQIVGFEAHWDKQNFDGCLNHLSGKL